VENDPSDDQSKLYAGEDAAKLRDAADYALREFTRGLTEELITRLRETAQADPKSPWLRHMLLESRKRIE